MVGRPSHAGLVEAAEAWSASSVTPHTNPFPGLRSFSVDECHLYFGREGQVDEILSKLAANRFVCVMGYSGSGKSSLLACGLVPVLYGGFVSHSSPHWHVIVSRPGSSPMQNLADAVVAYMETSKRIQSEDLPIYRAIILSVLRSGPHGLVEVSKFLQTFRQDNIFFMLDQFEELFRLQKYIDPTDAENEIQAYINLVLHAINQAEVPVFVAVTMRTDFLSRCAAYPALAQAINTSNYLVPQMTRDQKRLAIEGPVAVAGGKITSRLVNRLLADMGRNQDQLPILQHALMRTWDYWQQNHEPGEPIDLRHYNAIGRMEQALSQHANEVLDELSPRQKEIAEILFKTITEKGTDGRVSRRPASINHIARLAGADEQEVIAVVEHFRAPGRSFLMPAYPAALTGSSLIELSHESLIRIWNRLSTWVEEEFESAQMYKRLAEASAMYQVGKTSLWRPPDLQLALNWQKKQKPTREWARRYDEAFERALVFLDTSRITYEAELRSQEMLQRRSLRRARLTAVILGIAMAISLLFLVFAYLQKIEADKNFELARIAQLQAEQQARIAEERRQEAEKATEAALAARSEAEKARQEALDALAIANRERIRAEEALREAERQKELAYQASENEREQRQIAEQKTEEARKQYERANALYYLAIAQQLAGKSYQEDDDPDLAGAQIMQAFHFNKRYKGRKYDPYIYNGLYHALKLINGVNFNGIKMPGPPKNRMNSVAVSRQTATFYAAGADGRVFQGDYERQLRSAIAFANPSPNRVVALSPNERYLAVGTDSSAIHVLDVQQNYKPIKINNLKGATNALVFLPNNASLLAAKGNKTVVWIDYLSGKSRELAALDTEIKSLSISPDGQQLAAGSWDGKLFIIDVQTGQQRLVYHNPNAQILSVSFSPQGSQLAFGTFEIKEKRGLVRIFDLPTAQVVRQLTGHKAGVYDVEYSPDGKLLASAGADRRLQMWVMEHLEDLPVVMDDNNGFVWDIAFSKEGDYLIAACHDSEIRIWPTDPQILAAQICPKLSRNMTPEEWRIYVGEDVPYETTCPNLLIKDYQ
jgi:Tol biopolymer transport system component/energy-coupling factor transporter ATP-binding protein EcfA2